MVTPSFMTASTGCGKSYLASALGYKARKMGLKIAYYSKSKRPQLSKSDGSFIKQLAKIKKVQLLILDD